MQIKIFIHFKHTIWFPGTSVCRKQMLKQMLLFSLEEYFYTTNNRIETPAGDLCSQLEKISFMFETVTSQRKNTCEKFLSDPFELRAHKIETRKVLKEKIDLVKTNPSI